MGGEGSGTPKAALLRLDGTQIDHQGNISQTDYFKFLELPDEHNAKLDKIMTPAQALKFRNHIVRMKVGTSAIIPMLCGGNRCHVKQCPFHEEKNWPIAEACHPPGIQIMTSNEGLVEIELLDPDKHKIVSFHRKKHRVMSNWRNGYDFSVSSKDFSGNLIIIKAGMKSHKVTPNHICVARFNDKAFGKFCVYLMKKGSDWRIGKSRIGAFYGESDHGHKSYLPFIVRGNKEEADAMWILGIYDLNTEALLAEEFFSILWQTSQVCFADSLDKIESKYDGLYRWATKEQIQKHYDSLRKPESFYREKLSTIGLDIDFPFWQRGNAEKYVGEIKVYTTYPMFIRACNLLPDIMEVPVYPSEIVDNLYSTKTEWVPIQIDKEQYTGKVYALDIKNEFKTYFANDIATHNCPIEMNLIVGWTKNYIDDLGVDVESRTEMILVNKLVECDIIDYRANIGFSVEEDAWKLMKTDIVDDGKKTTEITNIHPLIDIKEKIQRVRQQVLESLAATRKEKYKRAAALKRRDDETIGDHFAKLKEALGAATAKPKTTLEALNKEIEDTVIDADWENPLP